MSSSMTLESASDSDIQLHHDNSFELADIQLKLDKSLESANDSDTQLYNDSGMDMCANSSHYDVDKVPAIMISLNQPVSLADCSNSVVSLDTQESLSRDFTTPDLEVIDFINPTICAAEKFLMDHNAQVTKDDIQTHCGAIEKSVDFECPNYKEMLQVMDMFNSLLQKGQWWRCPRTHEYYCTEPSLSENGQTMQCPKCYGE